MDAYHTMSEQPMTEKFQNNTRPDQPISDKLTSRPTDTRQWTDFYNTEVPAMDVDRQLLEDPATDEDDIYYPTARDFARCHGYGFVEWEKPKEGTRRPRKVRPPGTSKFRAAERQSTSAVYGGGGGCNNPRKHNYNRQSSTQYRLFVPEATSTRNARDRIASLMQLLYFEDADKDDADTEEATRTNTRTASCPLKQDVSQESMYSTTSTKSEDTVNHGEHIHKFHPELHQDNCSNTIDRKRFHNSTVANLYGDNDDQTNEYKLEQEQNDAIPRGKIRLHPSLMERHNLKERFKRDIGGANSRLQTSLMEVVTISNIKQTQTMTSSEEEQWSSLTNYFKNDDDNLKTDRKINEQCPNLTKMLNDEGENIPERSSQVEEWLRKDWKHTCDKSLRSINKECQKTTSWSTLKDAGSQRRMILRRCRFRKMISNHCESNKTKHLYQCFGCRSPKHPTIWTSRHEPYAAQLYNLGFPFKTFHSEKSVVYPGCFPRCWRWYVTDTDKDHVMTCTDVNSNKLMTDADLRDSVDRMDQVHDIADNFDMLKIDEEFHTKVLLYVEDCVKKACKRLSLTVDCKDVLDKSTNRSSNKKSDVNSNCMLNIINDQQPEICGLHEPGIDTSHTDCCIVCEKDVQDGRLVGLTSEYADNKLICDKILTDVDRLDIKPFLGHNKNNNSNRKTRIYRIDISNNALPGVSYSLNKNRVSSNSDSGDGKSVTTNAEKCRRRSDAEFNKTPKLPPISNNGHRCMSHHNQDLVSTATDNPKESCTDNGRDNIKISKSVRKRVSQKRSLRKSKLNKECDGVKEGVYHEDNLQFDKECYNHGNEGLEYNEQLPVCVAAHSSHSGKMLWKRHPSCPGGQVSNVPTGPWSSQRDPLPRIDSVAEVKPSRSYVISECNNPESLVCESIDYDIDEERDTNHKPWSEEDETRRQNDEPFKTSSKFDIIPAPHKSTTSPLFARKKHIKPAVRQKIQLDDGVSSEKDLYLSDVEYEDVVRSCEADGELCEENSVDMLDKGDGNNNNSFSDEGEGKLDENDKSDDVSNDLVEKSCVRLDQELVSVTSSTSQTSGHSNTSTEETAAKRPTILCTKNTTVENSSTSYQHDANANARFGVTIEGEESCTGIDTMYNDRDITNNTINGPPEMGTTFPMDASTDLELESINGYQRGCPFSPTTENYWDIAKVQGSTLRLPRLGRQDGSADVLDGSEIQQDQIMSDCAASSSGQTPVYVDIQNKLAKTCDYLEKLDHKIEMVDQHVETLNKETNVKIDQKFGALKRYIDNKIETFGDRSPHEIYPVDFNLLNKVARNDVNPTVSGHPELRQRKIINTRDDSPSNKTQIQRGYQRSEHSRSCRRRNGVSEGNCNTCLPDSSFVSSCIASVPVCIDTSYKKQAMNKKSVAGYRKTNRRKVEKSKVSACTDNKRKVARNTHTLKGKKQVDSNFKKRVYSQKKSPRAVVKTRSTSAKTRKNKTAGINLSKIKTKSMKVSGNKQKPVNKNTRKIRSKLGAQPVNGGNKNKIVQNDKRKRSRMPQVVKRRPIKLSLSSPPKNKRPRPSKLADSAQLHRRRLMKERNRNGDSLLSGGQGETFQGNILMDKCQCPCPGASPAVELHSPECPTHSNRNPFIQDDVLGSSRGVIESKDGYFIVPKQLMNKIMSAFVLTKQPDSSNSSYPSKWEEDLNNEVNRIQTECDKRASYKSKTPKSRQASAKVNSCTMSGRQAANTIKMPSDIEEQLINYLKQNDNSDIADGDQGTSFRYWYNQRCKQSEKEIRNVGHLVPHTMSSFNSYSSKSLSSKSLSSKSSSSKSSSSKCTFSESSNSEMTPECSDSSTSASTYSESSMPTTHSEMSVSRSSCTVSGSSCRDLFHKDKSMIQIGPALCVEGFSPCNAKSAPCPPSTIHKVSPGVREIETTDNIVKLNAGYNTKYESRGIGVNDETDRETSQRFPTLRLRCPTLLNDADSYFTKEISENNNHSEVDICVTKVLMKDDNGDLSNTGFLNRNGKDNDAMGMISEVSVERDTNEKPHKVDMSSSSVSTVCDGVAISYCVRDRMLPVFDIPSTTEISNSKSVKSLATIVREFFDEDGNHSCCTFQNAQYGAETPVLNNCRNHSSTTCQPSMSTSVCNATTESLDKCSTHTENRTSNVAESLDDKVSSMVDCTTQTFDQCLDELNLLCSEENNEKLDHSTKTFDQCIDELTLLCSQGCTTQQAHKLIASQQITPPRMNEGVVTGDSGDNNLEKEVQATPRRSPEPLKPRGSMTRETYAREVEGNIPRSDATEVLDYLSVSTMSKCPSIHPVPLVRTPAISTTWTVSTDYQHSAREMWDSDNTPGAGGNLGHKSKCFSRVTKVARENGNTNPGSRSREEADFIVEMPSSLQASQAEEPNPRPTSVAGQTPSTSFQWKTGSMSLTSYPGSTSLTSDLVCSRATTCLTSDLGRSQAEICLSTLARGKQSNQKGGKRKQTIVDDVDPSVPSVKKRSTLPKNNSEEYVEGSTLPSQNSTK